MRTLAITLLTTATLLAGAGRAQACPNCKTALSQQTLQNLDVESASGAPTSPPSSSGDPGRAFSWSVIAMLGILSLAAGGLIRTMIQAARAADQRIGQHP
jgi:hypothetical protein